MKYIKPLPVTRGRFSLPVLFQKHRSLVIQIRPVLGCKSYRKFQKLQFCTIENMSVCMCVLFERWKTRVTDYITQNHNSAGDKHEVYTHILVSAHQHTDTVQTTFSIQNSSINWFMIVVYNRKRAGRLKVWFMSGAVMLKQSSSTTANAKVSQPSSWWCLDELHCFPLEFFKCKYSHMQYWAIGKLQFKEKYQDLFPRKNSLKTELITMAEHSPLKPLLWSEDLCT